MTPMGSNLRERIGKYVLPVKQALCFTCLKDAGDVQKCSSCLRASYCSKACQVADWKSGGHKSICKVLVSLNDRKVETPVQGRTWAQYEAEKLLDAKALDININTRTPPGIGIQCVLYEPFCRHCFRRTSQLYAGEHLKACETCRIESYCSTCGQQEDHKEDCEKLQIFCQDRLFDVRSGMEGIAFAARGFKMLMTKHPVPLNTYKHLSTVVNWYDYYTNIVSIPHLSSWVTPSWVLKVHDAEAADTVGWLRQGSILMSSVLTIIAALEAAFPDIGSKTTLRLHFIGAEDYEIGILQILGEILHLLPALKELEIHFIGHGLPDGMTRNLGLEKSGSFACCPKCHDGNHLMTLSLWKGLYHDYVATASYKKPDLALGWLYPGHHSEWLPTVAHLVKAKHASLFMCSSQASMWKEVLHMKIRFPTALFIQEPGVNKWKTMSENVVPLFMPDDPPTKENRFTCQNKSWYVFTRM